MFNAGSTKSLIVSVGLVLSSIVALFSWAVSSPVAASPDEGYLLSAIWCSQDKSSDTCTVEVNGLKNPPVEIFNWCFQHNPEHSGNCSSNEISATPQWEKRVGPSTSWTKLMNSFAFFPVGKSTILIRFVSLLLVISILSITFKLSNRMHRFAMIASLSTIFIPHGLYLVGMGHPSGLASALMLSSVLLCNQILNKQVSRREKQIAYVIVFLDLVLIYQLRREAIIFFLASIGILILLRFWSSIVEIKKKILITSGFVLASAILLQVVMSIFPLFLPFKTNVWGSEFGIGRAGWNVFTTNFQNFPSIIIGNFGYWGLGSLDIPLPSLIWVCILMLTVGFLSVSLLNSNGYNLSYFLISTFTLVFLIIVILQESRLYVGEEMQPRYFLPFITAIFSISIANSTLVRPKNAPLYFGFVVTAAAASLANSISLWTTLRRYTSGLDVGELDLNYNREWWWNFPLDPNQVWFLGTVSFGIAVSLGIYSAVLTKGDRSLQGIEGSRI